jgi:lysophospholipase L1-like esterase
MVKAKGGHIMALSLVITFLLTLTSFTNAYVVHGPRARSNASSSTDALLDPRAGPNPADFSWIKKWAAIGDSFTAGIGAGSLYSRERGDYKCSRYDRAYPAVINRALGPSVQDFQFVACTGDRSAQIYEQVSNIKGSQDLVIMTAGGNDLCLVSHASD